MKQTKCPTKLNDPFGRVNRKHHAAYLALRERMRQQGITDPASAATVASGMSRAAIVMVLAIAALAVLIALTLPGMQGVAWVLGGLSIIWIIGNYFQARMHLKRYVLEECHVDADNDATGQNKQSKTESS